MVQGDLGLADSEFWSAPQKTRQKFELKARSEDQDLTVVDAPHRVDLRGRETAPLVVLRVAATDLISAVPLALYAIVVATDLQRGEGWSGLAIEPPSRPVPPMEPPVPTGSKSRTGEMRIIDLRARLDLPWRPAKLAVWMLLRETDHGPLLVELGEPPTAYKDKAVEEAREAKLKAGPPPPISPSPGGALLAWGKAAGAPAPPEQPGFVVEAPRLVKTGDDQSVVVRGSFRLPIAPRFVVKAGKDHDELARSVAGRGTVPAALAPITAVTTSSVDGLGFHWNWALPADSVEGTPEAPIAVGRFAVDIGRLGNLSAREQTVFFHLFSGVQHGRADVAFSAEAE